MIDKIKHDRNGSLKIQTSGLLPERITYIRMTDYHQ